MSKTSRYYFKELRLQQFRGLVALSRWQTFSAAATALRLTRASVWQQVHSLEKEMGCTLLRTRGHRVELTDAGRKLVEIVAPLVAGFDSVKSAFASLQGDLPQTLAIAAAPIFLMYELREPISQINRLYPKLHLTFQERNSPAAIELLDQGGADLAVVAHPENLSMKSSLEYTRLTSYPFTLICPPNHKLHLKKQLTLRDFVSCPLILPGNVTYCRKHFDTVLGRAGLLEKVNIVLESNFPIMLFEYVRMGLGLALAPLPPELFQEKQLQPPGIALRNVSSLFGDEPIYYVCRKGQLEMPCASKFRELVMAHRAEHRSKKMQT
jgi:LysR family hydrogen peroxide-inducible transcriptional activator